MEEEVLDWLTEMKVESHIELITRPMLETMVEETQYLAVFFCKRRLTDHLTSHRIMFQISKTAELVTRSSLSWRTSTMSATCMASRWSN